MVNHYDILRVKPDASLLDIKQAYKRRLLDVHPDKKTGEKKVAGGDSVIEIKEAYRVLSHEKLRQEYELEIVEGQKKVGYVGNGDGLDEYSLDDFEFEPGTLRYYMNCPRCVAEKGFSLEEATLEDHAKELGENEGPFEVLTQCSSCSLWLKINFSLAMEEAGEN